MPRAKDPPAARRLMQSLQRTQEVQEILLIVGADQVIQINGDVGLRSVAAMSMNGANQIAGAAVMEEEETLSNTPQRSGAELASIRISLRHAILQACSHIMYGDIGEGVECLIVLTAVGGLRGVQRLGMAESAANCLEDHLTARG